MTDDKSSKGSRFKSKWGKILKQTDHHNDSPTSPGAGSPGSRPNYALDSDVVDFLKPSTDKAALNRPKLDIAIAQRWPEAHDVKKVTAAAGQPLPEDSSREVNGWRKRRRREGLRVGFTKGVPEVIGEGGDESPDPPSVIGSARAQARSQVGRSVSARQAEWVDNGADAGGQQFRPVPLRRADTGMQAPQNSRSPPAVSDAPPPPRIGISRTPTGFSSQDEPMSPSSPDDGTPPIPAFPPQLSAAPSQPGSLAARKKYDMRASEGMALRRASAMIEPEKDIDDEDEAQQEEWHDYAMDPAVQGHNQVHAAVPESAPARSMEPGHEQGSREVPIRAPAVNDDAIVPSPDSPSPFADPKYTNRRSREVAPSLVPQEQTRPSPPTDESGFLGSVLQASYNGDGASLQREVKEVPMQGGRQPVHAQAARQDPIMPRNQPYHEARPPDVTRQSPERAPRAFEQPSYMRTVQQPSLENQEPPQRAPQQHPAAQQGLQVMHDQSRSRSNSSRSQHPHLQDQDHRMLAPSLRANGSSQSVDRLTPSGPDPRGSSTTGASYLGQPQPSPYSRGPSPADYFGGPRPMPTSAKSPMAHLLREEAARPGSAQSDRSVDRPAPSPQPPSVGNPAADAAFADFAGRVAHVKGVFRLTAEKEQPADRCTPIMWLRAALWWYLRGKTGLEGLLQQRSKTGDTRELLAQPHVDLAKTWWILTDPLDRWDEPDIPSPMSAPFSQDTEALLKQSCAVLKSYLKALTYSMSRNKILPPPASLIQGQDTQIWLGYPRFTSDAAAVLGGAGNAKSLIVNDHSDHISPLEALPLGDNRDMHCYTRYSVEASINTDEADTDRIGLPCYLTVLRGTRDYTSSIVIASQSELVSLKLGPQHGEGAGLSWHDVSWKASSLSMSIRLPRGFDLTVRFHERDFRSLWNLVEYTRQVEHRLRPLQGETLVHEARLAEVQYPDSAKPNAFPADKVRGCLARIWERHVEQADGYGMHKLHRGFRLLVVTDPGHKTLSSFSHELGASSPMYFEFITDAAANGTTAMILRIQDESRQCRMLLVFRDMDSRQMFHDILNGLDVKDHETIVGKMSLTSLNIQPAMLTTGVFQSRTVLSSLQWQKLGVTNEQSHDPNSRLSSTVSSESLRIVARHAHGCVTDRMNLDKGELLLRFHCDGTPSVQVLRNPQADLSMSIDTRNAAPGASDAVAQALRTAQESMTIRTFTFASPADLHAFQAATTGFAVRYDGVSASLGISRRRMVVPIYHKWTAVNVRLQIVANAHNSVIQLLAFMEDFAHADALCFQVKSTDVFETVKGDGKGKKWAVVCKDAKFSLPKQKEEKEKRRKGEQQPGSPGEERGEEDPAVVEQRIKRRFVNLEGLEYAEEHDDVTIGFDTEEEHDRFAKALPATATVGRMITLRRKI